MPLAAPVINATRPATDRLLVDSRGLTAPDSNRCQYDRVVVAEIGPGDWAWAIFTAFFGCIPIGISVWALLDAAHRPEWAWALAGKRRVAWMAAIMFGVLTVIGGLIISAWYLTSIRPRIAAAEEGDINA
jgi:hypothetical protein